MIIFILFLVLHLNFELSWEMQTRVPKVRSSLIKHAMNSKGMQTRVPKVRCNLFKDVLHSKVFVDKTKLIREFFEYEFVQITAPRHFGKSVNIDMIRRFAEMNVDRNGNSLKKYKTANYKIFSSKYKKGNGFEYLDVYKDVNSSKFFNKTFGEYPVLYLDFKELRVLDWEDFLDSFRIYMLSVFSRYKYLLKSDELDDDEIDTFLKYSRKEEMYDCNQAELIRSGYFLTELIFSHTSKRLIVLIDDFDKPVLNNIFRCGTDVELITGFMDFFLARLLQTNYYVERALINSCIRLNLKINSDGLEDIDFFPFSDKHIFNKFFGFTEKDLEKLIFKLKIKTDESHNISHWYGGYTVRNNTLKVYNPYSVANYLSSHTFSNFWADKYYDINIEKVCLCDEVYNKIFSAIQGKTIKIETSETVTAEDLEYIKGLIHNSTIADVHNRTASIYLTFMLDLGYFTRLEKQFSKDGKEFNKLIIPNEEIRSELERRINNLSYLKHKFLVSNSDISSYFSSVENLSDTISSIEEFGKSAFSLFRKKGFLKDKYQLHDTLAAFLWYYNNHFILVKSDYQIAEDKFIDLLIVRNDSTRIIIKLKSKVYSSSDELRHSLKKAVAKYDKYINEFYKNITTTNRIFVVFYLNSYGNCSVSYKNATTNKAVIITI